MMSTVRSTARVETITLAVIVMTMLPPRAVTAQDLSEPVVLAMPPGSAEFGRIDQNLRGRADGLPEVITLSPASAANVSSRTMTAQPRLYWYLSRDTTGSATFILREHRSRTARPLFQCEVAGPVARGIHQLALSDYGVSLSSGTNYSWFVRLREAGTSEPIASTSFIQVVDLSSTAGLREELAATSLATRYQRYARAFWYEALATIIEMAANAPLSKDYRNRYVELLLYGKLDDAAKFVEATSSIVPTSCLPGAAR